jgi:RNA polymerase sigma-70 factor (ECF subfamily)
MDATIHGIQSLFCAGVIGALSDGQLLDRFLDRHEAAVFEAIVRRHGPMVWGVCRRVLRDHHDAEDAFQATFLVLALKSASIMPREKLGNWLYGVAYQTAMKARVRTTRRRGKEVQVSRMPEPEVPSSDLRGEATELLDHELSQLPERYRIPVILCEFEGRTHKEAASQLGWPIGTVSSRLSRAKSMLARRLSRRGVSLSLSSLAVLLAQESASANIQSGLIQSTAQAAGLLAAGESIAAEVVSAEVIALTGKVLRIMVLSKLKMAGVVLLAGITLIVAGTSFAYQETRSKQASGGSGDRNEPADLKSVDVPALPGGRDRAFGGGANEPLYRRRGDLFFVTSPVGDKFSIYDAATNKASTVRLPGTKESPLRVTPVLGPGNLISLTLGGPRLTRLHVFCTEDWRWYPQDLKQPVAESLSVTMGRTVAGYASSRNVYAFSVATKRWSILELPQDATRPDISWSMDSIIVEYDGQVDEFRGETGAWKHTNLRAIIDAAIKAAEDFAK